MSGLFPPGKNFLQSILDGDADGVDALEYLMQVAITAREVVHHKSMEGCRYGHY